MKLLIHNLKNYKTVTGHTLNVPVGTWARMKHDTLLDIGNDQVALGVERDFYNCVGVYIEASKDGESQEALLHFNNSKEDSAVLVEMLDYATSLRAKGYDVSIPQIILNQECTSQITGTERSRELQVNALDFVRSGLKEHGFNQTQTRMVGSDGFTILPGMHIIEKSAFKEQAGKCLDWLDHILADKVGVSLIEKLQAKKEDFSSHKHGRS